MRILLILLFISFSGFSQEEEERLSKFYLGIGGGVSFIGGDINYYKIHYHIHNYSTGINLTLLNLGYRINKRFGVTVNWNSSAHRISRYGSSSDIGIDYLSFGGIISVSTKQFTWDIKPQYAPSVVGDFGDNILQELGVYETYLLGKGFVFGNSLVRSTKQGFTYSLDLDYLLSYFNKTRIDGIIYDDNSTYNSFRIGVGIRYNLITK